MLIFVLDYSNEVREISVFGEKTNFRQYVNTLYPFILIQPPKYETINKVIVDRNCHLYLNFKNNATTNWSIFEDFKNNQIDKQRKSNQNESVTFNHERFDFIAEMLKEKCQIAD